MTEFKVLIGIDRAARDTGRRLIVRLYGRTPMEAALAAESKIDAWLADPLAYSHAIRVRPTGRVPAVLSVPTAAMPLAA
jgi:hypothetical protein